MNQVMEKNIQFPIKIIKPKKHQIFGLTALAATWFYYFPSYSCMCVYMCANRSVPVCENHGIVVPKIDTSFSLLQKSIIL